MDIGQIKECIGTDVQVSEVNVLPGRTNTPGPERIMGESEEDSVPGEGELYYDIRFSVFCHCMEKPDSLTNCHRFCAKPTPPRTFGTTGISP